MARSNESAFLWGIYEIMRLMESYIRNLQVTEKLRRIAQKFRQADEEYQKKQNEKLKEAHKKKRKMKNHGGKRE